LYLACGGWRGVVDGGGGRKAAGSERGAPEVVAPGGQPAGGRVGCVPPCSLVLHRRDTLAPGNAQPVGLARARGWGMLSGAVYFHWVEHLEHLDVGPRFVAK